MESNFLARESLLRTLWPKVKEISRDLLPEPIDLVDLWHVYIPLAQWLAAKRRALKPSRLFIFGVTGSIGRGKSVFCSVLSTVLNAVLNSSEGRALSLSLDDFYLPKRDRQVAAFLARGYNPDSIPNRGPAGTHDLRLLQAKIKSLEKSHSLSSIELPRFDKRSDDRAPRPRIVKGRVGLLILEGWFIGAPTQSDFLKIPPGLRRSVAEALSHYAPIFSRIDVLWAFERISLKSIVVQREGQERTLELESGKRGMRREVIDRFVKYLYKDAWQPGLTAPWPDPPAVTFWADVNSHRRFNSLRRGKSFDPH